MIEVQRQLSSLSLAVVLLSPGQRIASVNPAAEQFLGQSMRRLAGRELSSLLRFDEARMIERMADTETQLSARAIGVTVLGQGARRVDVTVAPVLDRPGWQVMTFHDISSVQAIRDDPAVGDDTVLRAPEILAHEIKNPLAAIRGAAQLLARKRGEGDRALTTLIADEVDRIAKLIDQMQSLSRRTPQILGPCNLHEAVRRARAVIEARGDAPAIIEEFDPSLPAVLGNGDALEQVLINLIANAVDACKTAGTPRIVIRTRFASGLQLRDDALAEPVRLPIELRVSDNGPGVDPALRDHVFEPFVSSKKNGQGLGLALVRRLVRDMNGRIGHDRDEIGELTHFRVHLAVGQERRKSKRESKL